jgi:peptidoglycan/xylan/chitin deacetylase (PgdA/CDA1 family)
LPNEHATAAWQPDRRRVVALTFDDGPDPTWTPRVVHELADADAVATFFVITARADAHPHLIEAILAAGHEVGLHCARHVRHTETTRSVIEADTETAMRTLAALDVVPSRWRVPWGASAEWTDQIAQQYGLTITGWSADTHDWRGDDATTMLDSIEPAIRDGGVVLMHDGLGPGARRRGCLQTARLIAPLAATIRRRGCEPASLAACAAPPEPR